MSVQLHLCLVKDAGMRVPNRLFGFFVAFSANRQFRVAGSSKKGEYHDSLQIPLLYNT